MHCIVCVLISAYSVKTASNQNSFKVFCCGIATKFQDAYAHYDWLKTVLIHPGNFNSGDRSMEKIKVILMDCYHHSHLFPLEFPLFSACVHARARLLCLSHCLCFCMCAWVCICYQVAVDLNANVCAYACVCVVCFNMSATCGNLIIWKWNMCSCLCLSSPAPPRSFSSFLCPSFFDSSNKFGRSGYTRWYMPTSPCISAFFKSFFFSFFCPKFCVAPADSVSGTCG